MSADRHFKLSIIKSGIRLLACCWLVVGFYVWAGAFLAVAELIGILEEL